MVAYKVSKSGTQSDGSYFISAGLECRVEIFPASWKIARFLGGRGHWGGIIGRPRREFREWALECGLLSSRSNHCKSLRLHELSDRFRQNGRSTGTLEAGF